MFGGLYFKICGVMLFQDGGINVKDVFNYKVSLFKSKFDGYHQSLRKNGKIEFEIKVFIANIWKKMKLFAQDFTDCIDHLVFQINFITVLERICLERGIQKIKIKNRCNPCKMEQFAIQMIEWSEDS